MRKSEKVQTRTFILQLMDGGRRKITIPATWKLTFGNVLPYNKSTGMAYDPPDGWRSRVVMRIYEGNKDNLRAVMHDVLSFREESMSIVESRMKLVTTARLKTVDNKQDVEFREVRVGEWYDPDIEFVQNQEGENNEERSNKRTGNRPR